MSLVGQDCLKTEHRAAGHRLGTQPRHPVSLSGFVDEQDGGRGRGEQGRWDSFSGLLLPPALRPKGASGLSVASASQQRDSCVALLTNEAWRVLLSWCGHVLLSQNPGGCGCLHLRDTPRGSGRPTQRRRVRLIGIRWPRALSGGRQKVRTGARVRRNNSLYQPLNFLGFVPCCLYERVNLKFLYSGIDVSVSRGISGRINFISSFPFVVTEATSLSTDPQKREGSQDTDSFRIYMLQYL